MIDQGFNVIRISVSWNDHILVGEEYKIEESLYYPYYENREQAEKMLRAVWGQIAGRFRDYDEHLIFEGMNKPRKVGTSVEWNGGDQEGWDMVNAFNAVFIDTVRQSGGSNPYRILMIPGYGANYWEGVKYLEVPKDDKTAVSAHAYEPYDFALNTRGIPVVIGEFGAMRCRRQ